MSKEIWCDLCFVLNSKHKLKAQEFELMVTVPGMKQVTQQKLY